MLKKAFIVKKMFKNQLFAIQKFFKLELGGYNGFEGIDITGRSDCP